MDLKLVQSKDIDFNRWDRLISQSVMPKTFAYKWYFDALGVEFMAVLDEDYTFAMPLPYYTKFRQLHIFTPDLLPYLGFYYKKFPDISEFKKIETLLPANVVEFDYVYNKLGRKLFEKYTSKVSIWSLELFNTYSVIISRYSAYLKDLISQGLDYLVLTSLSPNEVIAFLHKIDYFDNQEDYDRLRRIISLTTLRHLSSVVAVFSKENKLLGLGVFLLSSMSADLLLLAAENDDKVIYAKIIDWFIAQNSTKTMTLNFSCRKLDDIIGLFAEFGGEQYYLFRTYFRRLPKFLRFFGKK